MYNILVYYTAMVFLLFSFFQIIKTPVYAGDVVINEVYYDVDSSHGSETSPVNEWIELYNKTGSPIDISGWTITDNSSAKIIPNGTLILTNGLTLISPDSTTWNYWDIDSSVTKIVMAIGNGLSNTGDKLILKDSSDNEIDKLSYGANIDIWNPSIPDVNEGHSLERVPGGQDNDTIADFIDQESPTPGRIIAQAPTPTPISTPSPTPSPTNTPTPTPTPKPPTSTPSVTPIKTPTPTQTKTLTTSPKIEESPLAGETGSVLAQNIGSETPTASPTGSSAGFMEANLAKILIAIGGVFLAACGLVFAKWRKEEDGGNLPNQ